MAVYAEADIPSLRDQMVEAGFRFKEESAVMTTPQMAEALGITARQLRRFEKKGVVPSPARDTANRRRWLKADLEGLKRRLEKARPIVTTNEPK